MPLQQHVEIDTRPATRYTSQGDAAVWLAYSLAGTAVLRFTDLSGEPIEIELGHTELAAVAEEVAAWEKERNSRKVRIHWTFTIAAARLKLCKLYPSIEV